MSQLEIVSSFVEGAPPGEVGLPGPSPLVHAHHHLTRRQLADVVAGTIDQQQSKCHRSLNVPLDIKSLTLSSPDIISDLAPAFEKYNEEQLVTVKLPGSSQPVSCPCRLEGDGRPSD